MKIRLSGADLMTIFTNLRRSAKDRLYKLKEHSQTLHDRLKQPGPNS